MATRDKLHFLIEDCPGPFRIVSWWVHMLEKHGNRLVIELTVKPVEAGLELLDHNRKFKIPFEVVLMGATTKYGHGAGDPRNVLLLGRFQVPIGLQGIMTGLYISPEKAAPVLNAWQWEVIFNPYGRIGFVAKLDSPLPEDWTM